ncbi:tyrosine-type recombinase/integrase [Aquimarina mytili]|uniref:Tyrosine-type recombinase/integrase n=1 Tax=Aquimarina mytili TaxID=874423 RepID=A0A937A0G7_9FLAO|nr:tyrosine-type recombinase/integrase [Aquimarina mytili]MBL0685731.1 tyrosine-type recombinase/integrase [Aquimarina mytili]
MKKLKLENSSYRALLSNFKEWLDILGYSKGVTIYYPAYVQECLYWLEIHNYNDLRLVTSSIIKTYYNYLKERPNQSRSGALSVHSLNNHINALHRFNEFLHKQGGKKIPLQLHLEKIDPLASINIVTQSEIKQLFKATVYKNTEERMQLRDKAMLVVLYSCGLRRNEAVNLHLSDILFDKQLVYVRKGKNYKERYVPINEYNMRILEDYVFEGRPQFPNLNDSEAFFMNYHGNPMGGQAMKIRLRDLIKSTGDTELIEKKITPHKLRHSIATHLLQNGVPIATIKQFLGHSSLESTQIYTHIIKQKL